MSPFARRRALRRLLDREQIEDVLRRFGRGSDRADLELLKSCYHPDAYEDHGYFQGNAWEFCEQAVAHADERHPDGGSHFMSSPSIEFDGDRAWCETYVQAVMRTTDAQGRLHLTFAGRYLDTFEKRRGEWRIARRVTVCDYALSERPDAPDWLSTGEPVLQMGTQGRDDPVYRLRSGPTG